MTLRLRNSQSLALHIPALSFSVTRTTGSLPGSVIKVLRVKRMALVTMRPFFRAVAVVLSSPRVFRVGNWLKVPRIYTARVSAQVVKFKAMTDWPPPVLVSNAMGESGGVLSLTSKFPIAANAPGGPEPAAVIGKFDFGDKSRKYICVHA